MKAKIYIICMLMVGLASCQFGDWHYVDFTDISGVTPGMFRVVTQQTTDMQKLVSNPQQLALWGMELPTIQRWIVLFVAHNVLLLPR